MQDITGAEVVEVIVRRDGRVVWVNVDGHCELRVCRIKGRVIVDDCRKEEERDGILYET